MPPRPGHIEIAVGLPSDHVYEKKNASGSKEKEIVKGLLDGRVLWTGNYLIDFWIYLKNNHVLISLPLAHRLDPFSKFDRLVVFLCGLCWSVLSAAVAVRATESARADGSDTTNATIGWSILFGIVVYIFTAAMKSFARCGCVQGILKGTPCGSCVESCGKCGMFVGVGLAAGMLALGITIMRRATSDETQFWTGFAINQAFSWLFGIVLGLLLFTLAFRNEKKEAEQSSSWKFWK